MTTQEIYAEIQLLNESIASTHDAHQRDALYNLRAEYCRQLTWLNQ